MEWKVLVGKEVFIKTKTSGVYSGIVEEIFENNEKFFIRITDKFDDLIIIAIEEIIKLKLESKSKKGVINSSY